VLESPNITDHVGAHCANPGKTLDSTVILLCLTEKMVAPDAVQMCEIYLQTS